MHISLSPIVIVYCPYHLLLGSGQGGNTRLIMMIMMIMMILLSLSSIIRIRGEQYQAHCSNKGRRPQCQGCLQQLPLRAATCNTKTKKGIKVQCWENLEFTSPPIPSPPSWRIHHINNLDARKNSPKLFTPPHLMFHMNSWSPSWNQGNLLKSDSLSWSHILSDYISKNLSHFIHHMTFQQSRECFFWRW